MTAIIINGKTIAAQITDSIANIVSQNKTAGKRPPGLSVILIGDDSASAIYVHHKHHACKQAGILSEIHHLPNTVTQDEVLKLIHQLNNAEHIDGILVQLPLPKHLDSHVIVEAINPNKDVDGFHPYNLGRLTQRRPSLRPCTSYGIMTLLKHIGADLTGKHAVVVGASNLVGRPMALELLLAKMTVTIVHRFSEDLSTPIKLADLLVVAIGKTGIIDSDWIKPGAIVIDVGINRLDDGSIVGDIDFDSAKEKASWITPVPGGVGPMTVAILLQNTLKAYDDSHGHSRGL